VKNLVQAEVAKIRTTRTAYGLLAGALALTALGVVGTILTANGPQGVPLDTPEGFRNVIGGGGQAALFVLVLGILGMAGEFRHGTISQTFLVSPHRGRVVAAKLVAFAAVGLAFGTACSALCLVVGLPWLAIKDVPVSLFDVEVLRVEAGVLAGCALYGILGVAVGALIRNQVVAIVVALVWSFIVEGLLVTLLPDVGRWLPGGAAAALNGQTVPGGDLLPMWAGALLLAAYGVLAAGISTRLTLQRDVT
jgi:ABC-type transport system involved in multi-copper enzyme maturation permease subunit